MKEKIGGDRFSVRPERPDTEPNVSEEGVVTGEIGKLEITEDEDKAAEKMRLIENAARKDAHLAKIFDEYADADPAVRAANILDRINEMRRELANSDMETTFKKARDLMLSEIANRLRELL